MGKRRDFVASVTAAVSRALPTAQVTVSKNVKGYRGEQKVKLEHDGNVITLIVHDKDAGKKKIFVHVDKPRKALKTIRTAFDENQIRVAA